MFLAAYLHVLTGVSLIPLSCCPHTQPLTIGSCELHWLIDFLQPQLAIGHWQVHYVMV